MKHFISIVFDKKPINEDIDVAVVAATSSANVGLLENEFEYEIYESENSTYVITIPTIKSLNEDDAYNHAQKLADKLFDAGFENFDIEFSVLESQINEATLRRGSRGPEVQALQQQLGVTADGIFGPATEQALRAFQQRAGIQVDGIAGGQTQAALAAGGSPRNAGAARPSTTPFQPGQGSTTQAPPAPTTAAPQTSPRPQPRPDMNLQGPTTAAPQTSPRPQPRPDMNLQGPAAPAAGGGRGDGNAEVARRRADAQDAASDRQLIARAQGATPAPAAPGEGPNTAALRARQAGQPAPTASNRPDPNDPRGNQIAPAAAPAAQTTAPAAPPPPAPSAASVAAQASADAGTLDPEQNVFLAPELPQPAAETPPAAPVRAPQPQTTPSSARPAGQPGRAGMAGDELNALDAIAADRASGALPTPSPAAAPAAQTTVAGRPDVPVGELPTAPSGQTARDVFNQIRDLRNAQPQGSAERTRLSNLMNQINVNSTSPEDAAQILAQATSAPAAPAAAPAAQTTVAGRPDVPVGALPGDSQAARGAADAAVDARMGSDASAAPAAGAAQALSAAMRGFGTDEDGIATVLQGIGSQQEWEQIKAAYDGDLLSDLASELSTRDYQRYVSSVLQAAGIQESVPARPKGAFMFRERAEWDELFGSRYNKDGSPRARTPVFESRKMDEETYHGNEFYEAYGEMWFNEDEELDEAEYQGRKVKLGKPMRGDVKKFKVYVKNPKGNVVKVNFGDPDMKIKKSNPARRRSFRARHNCDNPGPRHKARYWSCRKW